MFFLLRFIALLVFAAAAATASAAQSTPPPPDWKDNGTSVYLGVAEKSVPPNDPAPSIASAWAASQQATTSRKFDSSVVSSVHAAQVSSSESAGRHLAPPGVRANAESLNG